MVVVELYEGDPCVSAGKLVYLYDEFTNTHISAVTFFPSDSGRGYDLYASSQDKNDVLYMNLGSGKVEMIEGITI